MRGQGKGQGGGKGEGRGSGSGRGQGSGKGGSRGAGGECVCPSCGGVYAHQRGEPCTDRVCPRCGVPLRRK